MTGLHLGIFKHLAAKVLCEVCALPVDADLDKRLDAVTQSFLAEIDREIPDDAVFFKRLDATLAGARRQVDAFGQVRPADAAVFLQRTQDQCVKSVHIIRILREMFEKVKNHAVFYQKAPENADTLRPVLRKLLEYRNTSDSLGREQCHT